jgi:hypothetical protein
MSKAAFTVEKDGSVTFHDPKVSDEVKQKAYEQAARERAHATNVPEEEVEQIVRESAELAAPARETGTEVEK